MKKKLFLITMPCCVFLIYFFSGEKNINFALAKKKCTIVATTSMIADAVKNIVGDCAAVYQLMGPGIDPHVYRARESDVHKLAQADLVFYNGLHLEGKMGQVLEGMHYFTKTVAVTDALDKKMLRSVDFDNMYDPHVWFDVSLWATIARYIQQQIMITDPDNAQIYSVNGDAYIQKLERLHRYVQERVNTIPVAQRVLITAHDAFGYFGRAYGFEVIGLQGLSTDSDISTKDIQKLAAIIVAKKMHAIFIESSIPTRALVAVQNAVAARGWRVEIGDELYSDALGNETTQAGSYCGMIMYNINTIIQALGK